MPAWPQPVRMTSPRSVSKTSDWSSGRLSSTRPSGARTRPRAAPVALGMDARHGAGEPDARAELHGAGVLDEGAAGGLVVRAELQQRRCASRVRPSPGRLQKIPRPTWARGQALRLRGRELAAQGQEARRCGRRGCGSAPPRGSPRGRPSARARSRARSRGRAPVSKRSRSPSDLDEGGEAPLADALVGEHGRQHDDAQRAHAREATTRWSKPGRGSAGWGAPARRTSGVAPSRSESEQESRHGQGLPKASWRRGQGRHGAAGARRPRRSRTARARGEPASASSACAPR